MHSGGIALFDINGNDEKRNDTYEVKSPGNSSEKFWCHPGGPLGWTSNQNRGLLQRSKTVSANAAISI